MASTAIKNEEGKKEYFDPPDVLEAKVEQLALWIQESSHFIAFTGAGISTSAGIQDFRSGYNTVLQTGPGVWEKQAQKKKSTKPVVRKEMIKALPSPTHMAFVQLERAGFLKFLVSQNIDGLHRKSGVPPSGLSELHGNTNLEKCKKCRKEYMRDFRTRNNPKVHEHDTGRMCDNPACRGKLHDTIINFGENLDSTVMNRAFENAAMADLCLAMGSSLRVTPAADIPELTSRRGKLVIVNLQKTPLDDSAHLVIHAFCDTVMGMVMEKLGLPVPEFRLTRRLKISKILEAPRGCKEMSECLYFQGIDVDRCPFSLFPQIEVRKKNVSHKLRREPMKVYEKKFQGAYTVIMHFQRHYSEPSLSVDIVPERIPVGGFLVLTMDYNPFTKTWGEVQRSVNNSN